MLCQNCNKKQATIHLTEIINEEDKREVHLCKSAPRKRDCITRRTSPFKTCWEI